jgi:hypothetical protein
MSNAELDPILRPILEARDEDQRDEETVRLLLRTASPVIEDVIRRSLRQEEIVNLCASDDLRAEATYRILRRLDLVRQDPVANAIRDVHEYVAVAAYNVFHDYLRRQFPERTKLSNRVRYLLTSDARFAMWERDGVLLCGFTEWRGQPERRSREDLDRSVASSDIHAMRRQLIDIFATVNAPLSCVDLVTALSATQAGAGPSGDVACPVEATPERTVEDRDYLQKLWTEIRLLPRAQRIALLLNLRDSRGEGAVRLLPLLGIASVADVRNALGLPAETFNRLWSAVPIADVEIAGLLQMTRQQVINLRAGARKRLTRRMARGRRDA